MGDEGNGGKENDDVGVGDDCSDGVGCYGKEASDNKILLSQWISCTFIK